MQGDNKLVKIKTLTGDLPYQSHELRLDSAAFAICPCLCAYRRKFVHFIGAVKSVVEKSLLSKLYTLLSTPMRTEYRLFV